MRNISNCKALQAWKQEEKNQERSVESSGHAEGVFRAYGLGGAVTVLVHSVDVVQVLHHEQGLHHVAEAHVGVRERDEHAHSRHQSQRHGVHCVDHECAGLRLARLRGEGTQAQPEQPVRAYVQEAQTAVAVLHSCTHHVDFESFREELR